MKLIVIDIQKGITDKVAPEAGEKIFVKEINSCFGNNELATYLDKQKDKVLLTLIS